MLVEILKLYLNMKPKLVISPWSIVKHAFELS